MFTVTTSEKILAFPILSELLSLVAAKGLQINEDTLNNDIVKVNLVNMFFEADMILFEDKPCFNLVVKCDKAKIDIWKSNTGDLLYTKQNSNGKFILSGILKLNDEIIELPKNMPSEIHDFILLIIRQAMNGRTNKTYS